LLKKAQPSRIVNVSSMAHRSGHINFEDIMAKKKYSGFSVYGNSKLANVLFTYELAERLAKTKVTVNCLHPGVISTGFGKNNKGVVRSLISLAGRFMLTPEEGAKTTNYLALSPEVEGITGKYFDKCKAVKSNAESYQMAVAKKLWNVSEKLSK
jgi:NAD(P)-dependent dehydrogenase (short-subunit alcohol dehydrogenase family)